MLRRSRGDTPPHFRQKPVILLSATVYGLTVSNQKYAYVISESNEIPRKTEEIGCRAKQCTLNDAKPAKH
ncbi:hypothetical protein FIBSPDRAFT_850826 [Athelia psychrophila]|uniref:Uncharacterized protein n=1 Tax=Athelia psychrophila TaxID=1759441 RepID=A0A166T2F7_9AGAM|nr:hypothetical protein FIBSPDRAFT_850826 [Fibularhizoctonia sp. CBS 109695]